MGQQIRIKWKKKVLIILIQPRPYSEKEYLYTLKVIPF